jgi:hypothetical protein
MSRFGIEKQVAWAAAAAALFATGCPQQAPSIGGGLNSSVLATADEDAIAAALAALESATTSINTTQNVTQTDPQTSRVTDCPTVEFSAGNTSGLNVAVSVDFGTSCTPSTGNSSCGGAASGSLSVLTSTLSLNFDSLTCDGKSLNGSVAFGFENAESSVTVTGDWDLTFSDGASTVGLDATGEATFDTNLLSTTFVSVTGVLDDNGDKYSSEWDGVVTSFFNNDNFIPQAGEISLSGNKIKDMTIRFNASSPSTGDVEVSINGGASFVYNLFTHE